MTLNLKDTVKKWMESKGLSPSEEELEVLSNDFKKEYDKAVGGSNEELSTPRVSTVSDSVKSARQMQDVVGDGRDRDLVRQGKQGEMLAGLRATKINQDTDHYIKRQKSDTSNIIARGDAQTQNVLALLGDTYAGMKKTGLDSKERMADKFVSYNTGYDDKVLGAIEGEQDMQRTQMNLGFVKDLLASAAILAM